MRTQTTRVLSGAVAADGSVTKCGSGYWSSRKAATGQYVITLEPGFRLLGANVGSTASGAFYAQQQISQQTDSSFVVNTYNSAGAATDGSFNFIATVVS